MPQCTPKRGDGLLFAKQIAAGFCNDLSRLTLIARHSNDDSEHCADQRVEHGYDWACRDRGGKSLWSVEQCHPARIWRAACHLLAMIAGGAARVRHHTALVARLAWCAQTVRPVDKRDSLRRYPQG
jgi:hypothetical protein